jgi:hypothetical protein
MSTRIQAPYGVSLPDFGRFTMPQLVTVALFDANVAISHPDGTATMVCHDSGVPTTYAVMPDGVPVLDLSGVIA